MAHPVGGLGQDNFTDYYLPRRHTQEEPAWVHSLELRLLAHTGLVGFILFAIFLVAALTAALRTRRRGDALMRAAAGAGLMALVVWLIHGSVDWFWEMPALSGPALGFLGDDRRAGAGGEHRGRAVAREARSPPARCGRSRAPRADRRDRGAGISLSVGARGVDGHRRRRRNAPATALHDLSVAAQLNPLSSDPGLRAGLIALSVNQNGSPSLALPSRCPRRRRLAGLAGQGPGAIGPRRADPSAKHSFRVAYSINTKQPPVRDALRRVGTRHPLTYDQALKLFVIVR